MPDAGGNDTTQLVRVGGHRILKLARTIAEVAGSDEIKSAHLAEALHAPRRPKLMSG